MRCPNCGMDIVIATHLCPHCGYAHDFDGRIEPRRDLPEPWEITPERARKRREKRERAAAAWARGRAGKKPGVTEARETGREVRQAGLGTGDFARAMHTFSLLSLGVMTALLFGSALLLYSGYYYDLTSGVSSDYVYSRLPSLRSTDQLLCVGYGLAGLFALSSLLKLSKREGTAVRAFHIAALLYAAASLAYGLLVMIDFKTTQPLVEAAVRLIPFAAYVGILTLHFKRSAAMYHS